MIKVTQVLTGPTGTELAVEFDDLDEQGQPIIKTTWVKEEEVRERLKTVKRLTGLDPDEVIVKNVLKTLIKEIRAHRKPLLPSYDYTQLIDLDLEAEEEERGERVK